MGTFLLHPFQRAFASVLVSRIFHAAQDLTDLFNTARNWAGRLDDRPQGQSDMSSRALDYSVQERPVQAMLLAMLVG
jgi:hypothetical protein